jgi:hypothetical protein
MEPKSQQEQQLDSRLRSSRRRYHYECGGEILANECMRCGASGEYAWAMHANDRPAMTKEYYPLVRFIENQS